MFQEELRILFCYAKSIINVFGNLICKISSEYHKWFSIKVKHACIYDFILK